MRRSRNHARGGSQAATLQASLGNHPSRDLLRNPAALLTKEGSMNPQFEREPLLAFETIQPVGMIFEKRNENADEALHLFLKT